jgi:polar amino acid transport system substrate-binding protein
VAQGKPAVNITYYPDNNACVLAIKTGRADIFSTDTALTAALAKKFPDFLQTSFDITTGLNFGVGVNKSDNDLLNAIFEAVTEIQSDGTEVKLLTKWGFAAAQVQAAQIVTS